MSARAASWPGAAERLARRVNRRRRAGVVLTTLGIGIALGALATLAFAWLAPSASLALPWLWLGVGATVGALVGFRAARRSPTVAAGDAAWALDRLAGTHERGLTAATVEGARGAEAAFAAPALAEPPAVRLLPARGVALLVGALLLGLVAGVAGTASAGREPPAKTGTGPSPENRPATGSAAGQAASHDAERDATRAEQDARAAARVLAALGLPDDEPADPGELAALLTDPQKRDAVRKAAGSTGPLGEALADPGASAEQMARRIVIAAEGRHEARRARRRAVAARNRTPMGTVPLDRRRVVDRYYERVRAVQTERDAKGAAK